MIASAIVRSGPLRSAGSVAGACGACTDDSMTSTVGSGLAVAKATARSISTSTDSSSSLSFITLAPRASSVSRRRAIGSRSIHSRSSSFVR